MANSYIGNVIRVDTSAAFTNAKSIKGIKHILGSAGSSIVITGSASSAASRLWEETVNSLSAGNNSFNEVGIRDSEGIYVTVAGGSIAYIYLAVR